MNALLPREPIRPNLNFVWAFYGEVCRSLGLLQAEWRRTSKFSDPEDVQQTMQELRGELDQEIVARLVACCEAAFREDLEFRATKLVGKGEPISKDFRSWYLRNPRHAWKIPMSEILGRWCKEVGSPKRFHELNRLFEYRHWVAHGGYWVLKVEDKDPDEAIGLIQDVLTLLPSVRDRA